MLGSVNLEASLEVEYKGWKVSNYWAGCRGYGTLLYSTVGPPKRK